MRGKLQKTQAGQAKTRITPADAGKTLGRGAKPNAPQDHPRGCGENPLPVCLLQALIGSPPRMRGKRVIPRIRWMYIRITPADAGKTLSAGIGGFLRRDHPRGCGENPIPMQPPSGRRGSPPRMRGKHPTQTPCTARARITPADAGKTILRHFRRFGSRDHPRGCGENRCSPPHSVPPAGSPPRMRGKRCGQNLLRCSPGITPADAGKTSDMPTYAPQHRDHPRGCGENQAWSVSWAAAWGSPPRMRGKLSIKTLITLAQRITPADAGKTVGLINGRLSSEDHPRGCGENSYINNYQQIQKGSPPRMRGKPIFFLCFTTEFGITPADAGKTNSNGNGFGQDGDHPRGCGEN